MVCAGQDSCASPDRWLARETDHALPHADAKGRDAYEFEPITSPYLEAAEDMRIRTPYSKTVIDTMRTIPWAHWDEEWRAWRVPFRSYEQLLRQWKTIEAAARRNEPDERKRRLEDQKNSAAYRAARLHYAEPQWITQIKRLLAPEFVPGAASSAAKCKPLTCVQPRIDYLSLAAR